MILPVILCGGSGKRLWPVSRKSLPKQFVPLINGRSLLELTMERLAEINTGNNRKLFAVAAEEHRFLIRDAASAASVSGPIILEPVPRNTTAAMAVAALHVSPETLLLFCPADHHIPDDKEFCDMVRSAAVTAIDNSIVTFGVTPSFPSTAYGYIEKSDARGDGSFNVRQFIEKPDYQTASALMLKGDFYWNAGIFLCKAEVLLEELRIHAADILDICQKSMQEAKDDSIFLRPNASIFSTCRSESIDYTVMERSANVVMVPFTGVWSDVGSWNAVADLTPADQDGNRLVGHCHTVDSTDTFIHAPHRPVVAIGTNNLLIVDTQDALLVVDRNHAEKVKIAVQRLEGLQAPQADHHRKVSRPWGWYDCVDSGDRFTVKRILVRPGASLSLQRHHHRAEHWVVVKGTAEVICGAEKFLLTENQSTYISIGQLHRLSNPGMIDLEMIEVQSGSYLAEDDIVRVEDEYGRGRN